MNSGMHSKVSRLVGSITLRTTVGVMVCSLSLLGCGGGGGTDAPPPPAPPTPLPDLTIQSTPANDIGTPVTFTTSAAPATSLKISWDFGDGTSSVEAAPQHRFERAGDLTVRLTLTNEAGTQKAYTQAISLTNKALVQGNYCSGANDQGWCWMPPQVSGNLVRDVQFSDASTGWRVDEFGDVFKTIDGGKSWARQPTGINADLTQLVVRSAQELLAVSGPDNLLLISGDGGKTWQKQSLPVAGSSSTIPIYALGQGKVLIVPNPSGVGPQTRTAYYLDGATGSWQTLALGQVEQVSVGVDGSILTYVAGQLSLRASPLATAQAVFTVPALASPMAYDRSELSRSQDQVVWLSHQYGPYVNGGSLALYRSLDGGRHWDAVATTISNNGSMWQGLGFVPTVLLSDATGTKVAMQTYMRDTFGGATAEALWLSGDGGNTWASRLSGGIQWYTALSCQGVNARLLCNLNSTIYVSSDYGVSFSATRPGSATPAGAALVVSTRLGIGISPFDFTAEWPIFAGSNNYFPYTSTYPAPAPSFGSRKVGRRVLDGSVFATSDSGRTWSELGQLLSSAGKDVLGPVTQATSDQTSMLVIGASMLDENTTVLLAGDGKVVLSRDGGTSWTRPAELQTGLAFNKLQFQDAKLGWVSGSYGTSVRLVTTRDGGISWHNVGALPASSILSVMLGAEQQLTLVDSNGGVYQSADDGTTWTNQGNASATLSSMFFQDNKTFWATGSAGALYKSADKGQTWQKAQLATSADLLAACFADGNNGWVSGQNGQLWATRDGGASWHQQTVPAKQDLTSLYCQDSRTVWAGGPQGLLATGTGGD